MPYKLAEVSGSLFDITSWERLGKYVVLQIVVGILLTIILFTIVSIFGPSMPLLTLFISFIVSLCAQVVLLSWYERWRGCNFNV